MSSESKRPVLEPIKHKGFTLHKYLPDKPLPEIPDFLYLIGKQNALNERRQKSQLSDERKGASLRFDKDLPRKRQEKPFLPTRDLTHEKQEASLQFAQKLKILQDSFNIPAGIPKSRQKSVFDQSVSKPVQNVPSIRASKPVQNVPSIQASKPVQNVPSIQASKLFQNAPSFQTSKPAQKAPIIQTSNLPTQAVPSKGYHTPSLVEFVSNLPLSTSKKKPTVCTTNNQRLVMPTIGSRQASIDVRKRESLTKPNNSEAKKARIVQSNKSDAFDSISSFGKSSKSKESNIITLDDFDDNEVRQWQFDIKSKVSENKLSNVETLEDFDDNEAEQYQFDIRSKIDNNKVKQSNFETLEDFDDNEAMQWQFELAKSSNVNVPHKNSIHPSLLKPNIGQENSLSTLHGQQKLSSGNNISHQRMPPTNQQKTSANASVGQQKPLASTYINQQNPLASTSVGQQKSLASTFVGQQKPLENTSIGQQKKSANASIGQQKPLASTSIGQRKPLASTPVNQQKPLASTSVGQQKTPASTFVGQNSANVPFDVPSPEAQSQVLQSSNVKFDLKGKFKSFLKNDTKRFQNDSLLPNDLRTRMYHTLRNVFGFRTFRFCQQSVIIASLLGNSCCVLMPTGAGKSLCYQLTALLLDGLTVVVSPLISLMNDQVAKMKCLKIFAASLHSDITKETQDAIFADLNGDVNLKLLYVTPEMLAKSTLLLDILKDVHRRGKLNRIVINEAHCISSWGHDFRTDYSNLPTYFKDFQGVPLMALIAAATPQTVIDIRQNLDIQNSAFFISSFVRSNISYEIMPKNAVNTKQLVKYLKTHYSESSGIFYCLSGQDCDKIAAMLNQAGLNAASYYASMDDKDRENAQNRWMQGEVNVICATIAFGMGIDKPDVRYVIHHSMPPSIENYYQETGRAGRDNLPSQCILLYSFADHVRYLKLFEETKSNPVHKAQRIKNLYKMIEYCENVTDCHQKLLIEHFGEFYDSRNCLQSQTQCHICNTQLASNYKAYDFTDEAVEVLKSIDILNKGKDSKATMKKVIDLYRGIEKKTKGSNTNSKLPLFKRGEGCDEEGVKRFVRKLLTDGYLSEFLEFSTFIKFDVCYIKLTKKGEEFVIKKKPKFYSYLSAPSKNTTTAHLNTMPIVSETAILKEKYKLKYIHVFYGALSELKTLMIQILRKETGKAGNPYNIISAKGIEQMAAMLPRTESEFLNIDSMSPDKYKTYAPRIMPIMQKYWAKIDRYENANVQQAVRQC